MTVYPPESAVVLRVDEKSQIQALARSQPAFPMMPGMPEKRTHDYVRHGTTSLFAAFDISDGTVISALHRRHLGKLFDPFGDGVPQRTRTGPAQDRPSCHLATRSGVVLGKCRVVFGIR